MHNEIETSSTGNIVSRQIGHVAIAPDKQAEIWLRAENDFKLIQSNMQLICMPLLIMNDVDTF